MSESDPPVRDARDIGSVARRLLDAELDGLNDDVAKVAAAAALCERVYVGLARWFGADGALALLTRAVSRARRGHPMLSTIVVRGGSTPCMSGIESTAVLHGLHDTTDSLVAVLTMLLDALSRLIGEDLAVTLIEQSAAHTALRSADADVSPTMHAS